MNWGIAVGNALLVIGVTHLMIRFFIYEERLWEADLAVQFAKAFLLAVEDLPEEYQQGVTDYSYNEIRAKVKFLKAAHPYLSRWHKRHVVKALEKLVTE